MITISDATTAKELRSEIVDYYKMRLSVCQQSDHLKVRSKDRKENKILIREFKYQIKFWSELKFREDVIL